MPCPPSAFNLETRSIAACSRGESVLRVLAAALQASDPQHIVENALQRDGKRLVCGENGFDLSQFERVRLVALGKAARPMCAAAVSILGAYLSDGIVVVKKGLVPESPSGMAPALPPSVTVFEAGHPIPDASSLAAAQSVNNFLRSGRPNDLVLCLISGGGSALLVDPVPGVSLGDLQLLTQQLLACGANISEINILRKHLDQIKGGGLARAVFPARLEALALSDVIGDALDTIASGPTVPDPTCYLQAWQVLEKYGLVEQVAPGIKDWLQRGLLGKVAETAKDGERCFERAHSAVIGSNRLAAQAALRQAEQEGFHTLLLTTFLEGEARQAGRVLGAIARQAALFGEPVSRPACIIAGGETTVTLSGQGKGGRNQELALGAVEALAGLQDILLVSLATDGDDGTSGAAGAVVSGETLARARAAELQPAAYLKDNDSYHFFSPLDDLLLPGPTQTNVNDLVLIFTV